MSDEDTRFLNVEIDVLHTGQNLNSSDFIKEVVDECIDSIKNTPVLGFIKYDASKQQNDFKGHEYILTRTENGIEEKYIGQAFGIIPESCNPRWITKVCDDDNIEREFLQVDALLWTKFSDATDIMSRDLEKPESMELEISSIEGYEDDEGIFHFTKFKFDGCCLLGTGYEPAMVNAAVRIKDANFSMNDFVKDIQEEFSNIYTKFTKLVNEKSNQGGNQKMPNKDFAQTVMQQIEDIANLVNNQEMTSNRWGDSVPRFSLADIQGEEVIVTDRKNNYQYYGFPFTVSGDKVNIDFTCGKRKKFVFEDYQENEPAPTVLFNLGTEIDTIEQAAFTKVEEANAKVEVAEQAKSDVETNYTQVKADYDEMKPKYDAYVAAEEKRQGDELNAQKDAKFAEYEDILADNADFTALKERKEDLSVDDIEKECAVLFVKASRGKKNFSVNNPSAKVGIMNDEHKEENYVATKYGNIPVRK